MGNFMSSSNEEEYDYDEAYEQFLQLIQPRELENEEPIDISPLPPEVMALIIDKLDYTDYAQLEQTSRFMKETLNKWSYSLPHYVYCIYVNKKTIKLAPDFYYESSLPRTSWHVATNSPVRIKADTVYINCRATSGRMQTIAKLFEKNKTTAEVLVLTEHILFTPKDLERVIKSLNISHLDCRQFLPTEFFKTPVLSSLSSMTLFTSGCTDDEIVMLKNDFIHMTNDFITARGLNRFLKQWKKREREISMVDIEFDASYGTRNFDAIIQGLDVNVIWTPAVHEQSLVANIPLSDYHPMKTGDPEHIYSIVRPDDIHNPKVIRLSNARFEVISANYEAGFLLSYLDEDQYYVVTNRCICCDTEFCYHRRKYSTQRLKKFFPEIYYTAIATFRISGWLMTPLRLGQLLLHSPSISNHVQPMTSNQIARLVHEEDPRNIISKAVLDLRVLLFNY